MHQLKNRTDGLQPGAHLVLLTQALVEIVLDVAQNVRDVAEPTDDRIVLRIVRGGELIGLALELDEHAQPGGEIAEAGLQVIDDLGGVVPGSQRVGADVFQNRLGFVGDLADAVSHAILSLPGSSAKQAGPVVLPANWVGTGRQSPARCQ
jgi:hypothetical protein